MKIEPMQTMIAGLAAAELGISTRTLGRYAQAGRIPSLLTPGRWRLFDPRDVARLKKEMAKRRRETQIGRARRMGA